MKTTFSRQFALIASLLLVCMIFTGVSFRFLMLGYLKNDKKETLSADAQAVAELEILGRRHRLEHLKLRTRRLCQPDGALRLIRQDGKLPPRRQADRLIEIKIRRLPFPAHGKHRHAQLEIQIDRSGTLAVKA